MRAAISAEPDASAREWAMLELQGELEITDVQKTPSLDGAVIGDIRFTKERTEMIIENQELDGKATKLAKPLAILRRVRHPDGRRTFQLVGMVKTKHVFKTRPKPIIHMP